MTETLSSTSSNSWSANCRARVTLVNTARWVVRLAYVFAIGVVAVGAAYLTGYVASVLTGRNSPTIAIVQIATALAITSWAGYYAPEALSRLYAEGRMMIEAVRYARNSGRGR